MLERQIVAPGILNTVSHITDTDAPSIEHWNCVKAAAGHGNRVAGSKPWISDPAQAFAWSGVPLEGAFGPTPGNLSIKTAGTIGIVEYVSKILGYSLWQFVAVWYRWSTNSSMVDFELERDTVSES